MKWIATDTRSGEGSRRTQSACEVLNKIYRASSMRSYADSSNSTLLKYHKYSRSHTEYGVGRIAMHRIEIADREVTRSASVTGNGSDFCHRHTKADILVASNFIA